MSMMVTKSIVLPSVDSAWRHALQLVFNEGLDVEGVSDPLSVGSSFGKKPRSFREIVGATIEIENPRNRLINSTARPLNTAYLLGNTVWTFLGSNKVSQIAFYNRRGWDFTDDQETVAAAPGKRIFQSDIGDQFSATAEILKTDSTSRRAVISIFTPEDTGSAHRDCSCLLTIQFLIRQGKLICVAGMRSQSIAMVFPYDAFLLTMLHEAMSVSTGFELGPLILHYGSLHYYHDEIETVTGILEEQASLTEPMPIMEKSPLEMRDFLATIDDLVRNGKSIKKVKSPDIYWQTFACALEHSVVQRKHRSHLPRELCNSWYSSLIE